MTPSRGLTAARRRGEWSATRTWRNGRRKGLKIPWEISREGSSPSVRTNKIRQFLTLVLRQLLRQWLVSALCQQICLSDSGGLLSLLWAGGGNAPPHIARQEKSKLAGFLPPTSGRTQKALDRICPTAKGEADRYRAPVSERPLLALSGHGRVHRRCPLSGVKRTRPFCGNPLLRSLLGAKRTCLFAAHMSASDPKQTLLNERLVWVRFSHAHCIHGSYFAGRGSKYRVALPC